MAALVLVDAEVLAGPVRLGGVANQVSLSMEAETKDVTTLTPPSAADAGWRRHLPGLRSHEVEVEGWVDTAPLETGALAPDAELWAQFGGAQVPVTITPTGADGGVAYICPTRRGDYKVFGKVGEVNPFSSKSGGDGAAARGLLIHPASVARTAGGTGTAVVLGTVPAGRSLLVAVHVLAVAGTSPQLTVTVQRDDNGGFSSPTTVATVGPTAVPTAALTTVLGPVTPDDRYRVIWTLTGTTPTARFAAAVGVTP